MLQGLSSRMPDPCRQWHERSGPQQNPGQRLFADRCWPPGRRLRIGRPASV